MEIRDFPGISAAKYRDGATSVESHGFADIAEKIRVQENTVFHACSVSKFVTSILVMILHQMNVLCLDVSVNTYLKGWKLTDTENDLADAVTLRHLLCHVSGVIDKEIHNEAFLLCRQRYHKKEAQRGITAGHGL